MIREISNTNPMGEFATHECIYEYSDTMTLKELLEIFDLISSVDGDKSEEVIWISSDARTQSRTVELRSTPTPGMDWYWCFPNRRRRNEILVYLTTEKQQTYFAMATTVAFPEEDAGEAILAKIRNHANTANVASNNRANSILDQIRARAGK